MAINDINNTYTSTQDKWAAQKTQEAEDAVAGSGTNPYSQLDKDAFLKLLLTELQYQDPTDPMDTAKMLEQTSQLASLEMQQNTNKIMKDLATQMQSSYAMTSLSALGKIAHLSNAISKDTSESTADFSLHFPDDVASGTIGIYDSTENLIKNIPIQDLKAGVQSFTWDGTDNNGQKTLPGEYLVKATYTNTDGVQKEVNIGSYPVEAIRFQDGKAQVKIAGQFVNIDKIHSFTEPVSDSTDKPADKPSDTDKPADKPSDTDKPADTPSGDGDSQENKPS